MCATPQILQRNYNNDITKSAINLFKVNDPFVLLNKKKQLKSTIELLLSPIRAQLISKSILVHLNILQSFLKY